MLNFQCLLLFIEMVELSYLEEIMLRLYSSLRRQFLASFYKYTDSYLFSSVSGEHLFFRCFLISQPLKILRFFVFSSWRTRDVFLMLLQRTKLRYFTWRLILISSKQITLLSHNLFMQSISYEGSSF